MASRWALVLVNTNFQYLKGNLMKLDREARIGEEDNRNKINSLQEESFN